jgi:hypothetical protein
VDGEIPKLFSFTRFDEANTRGDFALDSKGKPVLGKDGSGKPVDDNARPVNQLGYLIDKDGNVLDQRNRQQFKKEVLRNGRDIPKVFKKGVFEKPESSLVTPSRVPSLRDPSIQQEMESKMSIKPSLSRAASKKSSLKPNAEVQVPPNYDSRKFNVCDIEGDIDVDEKGDAAPGEPDPNDGLLRDKQGQVINNQGYLLDPSSGNVINNHNGGVMFKREDLDDRGEISGPFCIDKYNFNAHAVRGDFDHDINGKPKIKRDQKGQFTEKQGCRVSERGYRVDADGNLIDNQGVRKLKAFQMTRDGDVPRLFSYEGRRFNLTDVIG